MGKLSEKIKEEAAALVPPTLFFFIALHLVVFERALMLKGTGISVGTSVSVTVLSLILGKAVLIADLLPFINRYPTSRSYTTSSGRPRSTLSSPRSFTTWSACSISGASRAASPRPIRGCSRSWCGRISGPSRSSCWC